MSYFRSHWYALRQTTVAWVLAAVGLLLLVGPSAAQAQEASIRIVPYGTVESPDQPQVSVTAAALDADGRFVSGLSAEDFQILDGADKVTPTSVDSGVHDPISIALVADNSRDWIKGGKASVDARATYVAALTRFIERASELQKQGNMRLTLLTVDHPAVLSPDSDDAPSADMSVARRRVDQLQVVSGDQPLRDRIIDAIRLLESEPIGRRRVLIVLTDGNDVRSPITYSQVLGDALQAKIQVFGAGVAAQQASQLRTVAAQTHGAFRNSSTPDALPGIMAELAEAVSSSYAIDYTPTLHPGTHSGQVSIQGRTSAAASFSYESAAHAPDPKLTMTVGGGPLELLWPSVVLEADPGAQRPVRNMEYLLDGHVLAQAQPGVATPVALGVVGLLTGPHTLSVRVDDGLQAESPPSDWTPPVPIAAGIAGIGVLFLIGVVLVLRRAVTAPRRAERNDDTTETGFFLDPEVSADRPPSVVGKPVPIRARGTLGRGGGTYGFDPLDAFYSGVSRKHVVLEVRNGSVFAQPCSSTTVHGTCVVEVVDPISGTLTDLPGGRFSEIPTGATIMLGAAPAPNFGHRPSFTLRGGALTAVVAPPVGADVLTSVVPHRASINIPPRQVVDSDPGRTEPMTDSELTAEWTV